jgi:hypothetical protein
VITALRTAVSVIACHVSAAVGAKLAGFVGFALAAAAGKSAAARTASATPFDALEAPTETNEQSIPLLLSPTSLPRTSVVVPTEERLSTG